MYFMRGSKHGACDLALALGHDRHQLCAIEDEKWLAFAIEDRQRQLGSPIHPTYLVAKFRMNGYLG